MILYKQMRASRRRKNCFKRKLTQHTHTLHTQTHAHTLPHSHPHTHLAWKWKVWRCVFHFVWSSQQKVYLKTNWKLLSLLLLLLFDCDLPRFASADSHIPQVPRSPHLLLLLSGPLPRQVLRRVKSTKNRKCSFYYFFFSISVFCFVYLNSNLFVFFLRRTVL